MNTYGAGPMRVLLDLGTRIVAIDSGLARSLGHDASELLDTSVADLLQPDELAAFGTDLVALVEGREPTITGRRALRAADGQSVDAIVSVTVRRQNGDPIGGFTMAVLIDADNERVPAALPDHLRRLGAPAALIDGDGRIADTNLAWGRLFATPDAVTHGSPFTSLVIAGDASTFATQLADLIEGASDTARFDVRCTGATGTFWCRCAMVPLDARRNYFTLSAEDVTEEHVRRRALIENEALFRSVSEASPIGTARITPDFTVVYANPVWRELTGTDATTVRLPSLIHSADRVATGTVVRERLAANDSTPVRCRLAANERWVSLRFSAIDDPERGVIGHVVTIAEDANRSTTNGAVRPIGPGLAPKPTDLAGVGDMTTGTVLHLNEAAADFFGVTGVSGTRDITIASLYDENDHETYENEIYPALRRGESWTGVLGMIDAAGNTNQVLQTLSADLDDAGEPMKISAVGADVSQGRATKDDLVYLATHDQLTGLPNRGLLRDHLSLALARSTRDRRPIAVLFIDLDRFKVVNDTYGHDVGDELLKEAARRMSDVLRPSDTVARIGGDEFLVLCEDIDGENDAMVIARRIRSALTDGELEIRGVPMEIDTSIGVAISNGTGTRDGDTLIRHADAAMYRAKQSGRARIELYDDVLRDRTQRRQEMTDQLSEALDEQALEVHYQPILDLHSGRVVAVEAFVRWLHPTQGLLKPAAFLNLAIDTGLDTRIDHLVIERASIDAARWHIELGDRSPNVHVNVTGRTLQSGSLPDVIGRSTRATGLPANKLCIELSEKFLMEAGELAEGRIDQVRRLGTLLAIDDVGTSATSLRQLRRYHLDMLKVDRSMITEIDTDPGVERLVGAAIALGRALDLRVAIEGVEDAAAVPILRHLGADVIQGRLFSGALPAARIEPLLTLRSTIARGDK